MNFCIGRVCNVVPLALILACVPAKSAEPDFASLSRCFFVYAAVLEAAKETEAPNLLAYAQSRVGWAGGYTSARRDDEEFSKAFNTNLEANKREAIRLREQLIKAIKDNDEPEFQKATSIARACDSQLGLWGGAR